MLNAPCIRFHVTLLTLTVVDKTCLEPFLLPTDAHNVKKRRVIKTF